MQHVVREVAETTEGPARSRQAEHPSRRSTPRAPGPVNGRRIGAGRRDATPAPWPAAPATIRGAPGRPVRPRAETAARGPGRRARRAPAAPVRRAAARGRRTVAPPTGRTPPGADAGTEQHPDDTLPARAPANLAAVAVDHHGTASSPRDPVVGDVKAGAPTVRALPAEEAGRPGRRAGQLRVRRASSTAEARCAHPAAHRPHHRLVRGDDARPAGPSARWRPARGSRRRRAPRGR